MLLAVADLREIGRRPGAPRRRPRRGVRGGGRARRRPARRGGLSRRLRDHRRADRHARRRRRQGRARDAHAGRRPRRARATPWLGENAILRAIDVFRAIQSLPFASRSSELFDRPSINLGRILGGDALNKVPDTCYIDVDVRYLPEQDPEAILAEVDGIPGADDRLHLPPPAGDGRSRVAVRARALRRDRRRTTDGEVTERRPRRRLRRGLVPARRASRRSSSARSAPATTVPRSGSRSTSLAGYRRALVDFATGLPARARARGRDGEAG